MIRPALRDVARTYLEDVRLSTGDSGDTLAQDIGELGENVDLLHKAGPNVVDSDTGLGLPLAVHALTRPGKGEAMGSHVASLLVLGAVEVLSSTDVLADRRVRVRLSGNGLPDTEESRLRNSASVDGTNVDLGVTSSLASGSVVILNVSASSQLDTAP